MVSEVVKYDSTMRSKWDEVVKSSRNATFLLERDFMDYHQDRFTDASLLFLNKRGCVVGLFPANVKAQEKLVESHGGLTYGGLVLPNSAKTPDALAMMRLTADYFRKNGFRSLKYKPIPHIYHTYPSEEVLYALFLADAQLDERSLSTTIRLNAPLPFNNLHRRKCKKAEEAGLRICKRQDRLASFWKILEAVLCQYHSATPTHSLLEISGLIKSFPENIVLYTVEDHAGNVIAGCLLFVTTRVVHVQYIAANEDGRLCGALDFLFRHLTEEFSQRGTQDYFDFGISTERGGSFLNEGLIFQKEGLGGRAICYDTYLVNLEKMSSI